MNCPKCNAQSSCGCKSCQERPSTFKRNIMKGDTIQCPYCKFKNSFDVWLDYDYLQYDKRKKEKEFINNIKLENERI